MQWEEETVQRFSFGTSTADTVLCEQQGPFCGSDHPDPQQEAAGRVNAAEWPDDPGRVLQLSPEDE